MEEVKRSDLVAASNPTEEASESKNIDDTLAENKMDQGIDSISAGPQDSVSYGNDADCIRQQKNDEICSSVSTGVKPTYIREPVRSPRYRDSGSVTMHTIFPSKQSAASTRKNQRNNKNAVLSSRAKAKADAERHGVEMQRDLDFDDLKRSPGQSGAMGYFSRFGQRLLSVKNDVGIMKTESDKIENEELESNEQYRIPPPEEEDAVLLVGVRSFFSLRFMDFSVWLYKTNWPNVMIASSTVYVIFVNFLTLILYAIANQDHKDGVECIGGWDYVGDNGGTRLNWEIAFSLSWTTFSTVGFGTISPDIVAGCYGLRYACAIAAFLGVLFAGFCSAIFFAKFTRLLGRAHVEFSSTVLIQFSFEEEGVKENETGNEGLVDGGSSQEEPDMPFPVAEFRIVNTRANQSRCEIIDAKVSCLVAVNYLPDGTSTDLYVSDDTQDKVVLHDNTAVNESVPLFQQKYHPFKCKASTHPYFKRIWYVSHVLDENSPLVKPEMRYRMSRCGHWPRDSNNHTAIRSNLVPFSDIIVSMNGISNLSASGVFAEKRYKFRDVHVGWQFAGMMYFGKKLFSKKKEMMVDTSLVHDILPQGDGGHEPIGVLQ